MINEEEANETLKRLKNHPAILESLKDILDITEGAKGIERCLKKKKKRLECMDYQKALFQK